MVNNMSPTNPLVTAFMAEASAYLLTHPPPPSSPSSTSPSTHPPHPPHPLPLPTPKDVFSFAPSQPKLNDELLSLCLRGLKTGTTSWPVPNSNSNANSSPNPNSSSPPSLSSLPWSVNDYSVLLDSSNQPAGVMRTTSLVICRFRDVPEDFALSEAEGSREEYMEGHRRFYGRWVEEQRQRRKEEEVGEGMEEIREFNDDEWVLCERFEMVYPPPPPPPTNNPLPPNPIPS